MLTKIITRFCYLIIIIILAVCLNNFIYRDYTINSDLSNLETSIGDFYMRGGDSRPVLAVYGSVTLGNNTYKVAEINGSVALITLQKNLWGQYAINSMHQGSANYGRKLKETAGKKYLLFWGRNEESKIALVSFELDSVKYEMTIPAEKLFIVAAEIDSKNKDIEINVSDLTMYDKQGADITEEIIY